MSGEQLMGRVESEGWGEWRARDGASGEQLMGQVESKGWGEWGRVMEMAVNGSYDERRRKKIEEQYQCLPHPRFQGQRGEQQHMTKME